MKYKPGDIVLIRAEYLGPTKIKGKIVESCHNVRVRATPSTQSKGIDLMVTDYVMRSSRLDPRNEKRLRVWG